MVEMADVFLECRNLLAYFISQSVGYDAGSIDIIMCIVFLASRNLRVLAWQEPHVKLAAALDAHTGLDVVGNLSSINERNIQCLCHMTRRYDIGSMSIYQGIAVDEFLAVILLVAQLLIIIIFSSSE